MAISASLHIKIPISDSLNAMIDKTFSELADGFRLMKLQKQYNKMLLIHKASMMCKNNTEALLMWQLQQMESTLKAIRNLKSKPYLQ